MEPLFTRASLVGLALFGTALFAQAQTQLKTTRLAIYSNGAVFRAIEGKVPASNGYARLPLPENLLNGTFWLYANGEPAAGIAGLDTVSRTIEAGNVLELLKANLGKPLTVTYGATSQSASGTAQRLLNLGNQSVLLLKTSKGNTAIRLSEITTINADNGLSTATTRDTVMNTLRVQAKGSEANIKAHFYQSGMTWHPSYQLVLNPKGQSTLAGKATIVNDLIDADQVPVTIILGDPQLAYGLQRDPLWQEAEAPGRYEEYAGAINSVRLRGMKSAAPQMAMADGASAEMAQEEVADFLILDAGKLDLRKKQNQLVPLFDKKITTKDFYRVELGGWLYWSPNNNRGERPIPAQHIIRFDNATNYLLMYAPVLVLDEKGNALGQLNMPKTAKNARVDLELNEGSGAEVKYKYVATNQKEVSRSEGTVLYRADMEGRIALANRLDHPIEIEVNAPVNGKVADAGGATVEVLGTNQDWGISTTRSHLRWTVKLNAGETKDLKFTYTTYARQ